MQDESESENAEQGDERMHARREVGGSQKEAGAGLAEGWW